MVRPTVFCLFFAIFITVLTADDRLEKLCEQVSPSIVYVVCNDGATGSGFIVASDLIMTNYHVVENAATVLVKFSGGVFAPSSGVMHMDKAKDIAVLQVPTREELMAPLPISGELPRQGQDVAAFGNPQGLEFSVTRGIVSGIRTSEYLNRLFSADELDGTWVQTDAAISKGNSGGPLVNYEGQVVAMNTFRHIAGQNLNFAVSCTDLAAAITSAKSGTLRSFSDAFPKGRLGAAAHADTDESSLGDSLRERTLERVRQSLPKMNPIELRAIEKGDIRNAFSPVELSKIREGQMVRIRENVTIIQVLQDGMLVSRGATKCFITFLNIDGADIRARIGDDIITDFPLDGIYLVGKSRAYQTVRGKTSYYISLLPVSPLLHRDELAKLVVEERNARDERERERRREAQENRRQRLLVKYRRTFTDVTGSHRVDAIIIGVDDNIATLFRVDTRVQIEISVLQLSAEDQAWISDNRNFINFYARELKASIREMRAD